MSQNGDSQTHVTGTPNEVRAFAIRLLEAADIVENDESALEHVHGEFEQPRNKGPWRVIISITSPL